GRHNYRVSGVRASVYYDALYRHLVLQWWQGEDIDADSGICHITKATACMAVFLDATYNGMWVDDRPPKIMLPAVEFGEVNADPNSASWQFDGILDQVMQWWEGKEDTALMDASYSLLCLRDSITSGRLVDDRPHTGAEWLPEMHDKVKSLIEQYPESVDPYTQAEHGGTGCDTCGEDQCPQRTAGDKSKCGKWRRK
ncbi:MAG: hypothetical protein GY934_13550, partial [Gammaproteobacteria bacterium]|nr:hypothetical protein [Gammaproteobacteria bacterium]